MNKPTNKEYKEIFDKVANNYDSFSNDYTVGRRVEEIVGFCGMKCLEVGAGTGKISQELRKKGCDVVASDISSKMVKRMKDKKIKAVVSDAQKLPFKDGKFDTIVASELIYYLDAPKKFISEAHRLLKNDGQLVISCANNDVALWGDYARKFMRKLGAKSMYFDDKIQKFFTMNQVCDLIASQSFEIVSKSKKVILPFSIFDKLNRLLERTFLSHLGLFLIVVAKKEGKQL
jgi:ubiquinone/menaquinone biosynthesis C-methylase UbiE